MLDIRYHIASLAAVFLALGFGILIGSSFAGQAAVRQMSYQVEKQNAKLDTVVQQNTQDHDFLKQNEDAIAALVPHLVSNVLAAKRVALVQTGDYPDAVKDAAQAITQAGGSVVSTTTLTGRFDMLSDRDRANLSQSLGVQDGPIDDSALLRPLAISLRGGTQQHPNVENELTALEQAGVITRSGDYTQPADMVVLLGGSATPPDTGQAAPPDHDGALIALLVAQTDGQGKLPAVVGCETRDAVQSSVPAYLRAGVASVDCIDQPIGTLDLPYALTGRNTAYGIKPTADSLLPQSLTAPPPAEGL